MTAPNHIIGGFTFTGIFASIAGINILQDYRLLPIILIGSLLPDIDHTKSIIGKAFYPIAKAINRKYGHRTITHSLFVWIVLTALISAFQSAYFPTIKAAQVFGLAYGSHLIFDMMTIQGVPLFYPFKKNPCVLPGNPQMRLRTSSVRQETAVFCFFMVSAIFLQPLFANGFWTSYNSLFGTLKHIVSEYNKSKDLMIVDFSVQHGSEEMEHKGLCVAVSSSEITILTKKKKFEHYPEDGQLMGSIYPTHTTMYYSFEQGQFHDITIDSMHRLFRSGKFTKMDLQANRDFIHVDQGIDQKAKKLSLEYPNELILRQLTHDTHVAYTPNPAIQSKREEIQRLQQTFDQAMSDYRADLAAYESLKAQLESETDEIKKEILMIKWSSASSPTPPKSIETQLSRLRSDIRQYQQQDQQQYAKAKKDAEVAPLRFSGHYERLLINGRNL